MEHDAQNTGDSHACANLLLLGECSARGHQSRTQPDKVIDIIIDSRAARYERSMCRWFGVWLNSEAGFCFQRHGFPWVVCRLAGAQRCSLVDLLHAQFKTISNQAPSRADPMWRICKPAGEVGWAFACSQWSKWLCRVQDRKKNRGGPVKLFPGARHWPSRRVNFLLGTLLPLLPRIS